MKHEKAEQLFASCVTEFGAELQRIASTCEPDPVLVREALHAIHASLWFSLRRYDKKCSLRDWTIRVARRAADDHWQDRVSRTGRFEVGMTVDRLMARARSPEEIANERLALEAAMRTIEKMTSSDGYLMRLSLDGWRIGEIAEATGLTPTKASAEIARIRGIVARQFQVTTSRPPKTPAAHFPRRP